jgi:DedD protein
VPPPPAKPPTIAKAPEPKVPTAKPGEGFAVQVAALTDRREADGIAKRLSGKGYSAYVMNPTAGTTMYRVRVGSFKTQAEANSVAEKLKKEERVNPWVTR